MDVSQLPHPMTASLELYASVISASMILFFLVNPCCENFIGLVFLEELDQEFDKEKIQNYGTGRAVAFLSWFKSRTRSYQLIR